MKVGYTLFFDQPEQPRNATVYRDNTAQTEGAVLLTVAVIGGLGNLLVLGAMVTCSQFKSTTAAFLSHHCILDAVKSVFCVPFAAALLLEVDIPYCNAVGATYIFLMTLTAYNLLGIHINEEYQLSDHQGYIPGRRGGRQIHTLTKKDSFWCVSFGIIMIWFTTILIHLGVAFLPSSAEFSYNIGNCVFNYGTPKNYVIHVLWAILVSAALLIAIICFIGFFCKLRAYMNQGKRKNTKNNTQGTITRRGTRVCRAKESAHEESNRQESQTEELHYEFDSGTDQGATIQMRLLMRRVVVMLLMVVSFLLFWYPLFILTIMDVSYTWPAQTYRLCMILAWTHPVTTPIFCGILYLDVVHVGNKSRTTYTPAKSLQESTSFSFTHFLPEQARARQQFHSDYEYSMESFPASNYSSPDQIQQAEPEHFYESQRTLDNTWFRAESQPIMRSPRCEDQEQGIRYTHNVKDTQQTQM